MSILKRIFRFMNKGRSAVTEMRRKYARKHGGRSVLSIGGREFQIQDWSRGGVCFDSFDVPFAVGDNIRFEMIFKLPHDTVALEHKAKVVRTTNHGANVAAVFEPVDRQINRKFDRVIDSFVTEEFIQSQAA